VLLPSAVDRLLGLHLGDLLQPGSNPTRLALHDALVHGQVRKNVLPTVCCMKSGERQFVLPTQNVRRIGECFLGEMDGNLINVRILDREHEGNGHRRNLLLDVRGTLAGIVEEDAERLPSSSTGMQLVGLRLALDLKVDGESALLREPHGDRGA